MELRSEFRHLAGEVLLFVRILGDVVEFQTAMPVPDELVVADADRGVRRKRRAMVGVFDDDVEGVVPEERTDRLFLARVFEKGNSAFPIDARRGSVAC